MSADKVERVAVFSCEGGPRDGQSFRLINPPPAQIRFGMPVWSTYEFRDGVYHYIGDVEIDHGVTF